MTLGINHKNPFNVKHSGSDPWKGTDGYDDRGHVIFTNEIYSVRAAVRILNRYQVKHRLKTLQQIFHRWAPVRDPDLLANNQPDKYAEFVRERMGHGAIDRDILLFRNENNRIADDIEMQTMLAAMAEYENYSGYILTPTIILSGMAYYNWNFGT